jgi:protein-S-isoprenylcysteine O-methyltransferase Ste14
VPVVALAIYLAFLAAAFGLRGWVHYRRTGDHGFRIPFSGGNRSAGWFHNALLVIGVVLAGAAPTVELFDIAKPLALAETRWLHGAGFLLALLGFAITLISQYQMGASWRVGVDDREVTPLVTTDLFGVVRNPIFTGMLLATAGLLLMVPNVFSAAALSSLIAGLEMQVRWIEEHYLARVHGTRYLTYARLVGRFLPWLGRLKV